MREMIRLFAVVTIFSAIAGGFLATVKSATEEKIELQELIFVRGPAINQIMAGCSNDPLDDRFKLNDGKREIDFFIGEFDGKKNTIAFETIGKGFGGNIGVMVAVNIDTDEIVGVGVTTHSETPGVGSRAQSDPTFREQFKGMSISSGFIKVTADGGDINALSGATITSRGVCAAVMASSDIYMSLKDEIIKNITG